MKRKGTHITLSAESLEVLDALASARETDEFPATNRTALVEKALQVWIAQVKDKYPNYRELIDGIHRKHAMLESNSGDARLRRKVVQLTTKPRA